MRYVVGFVFVLALGVMGCGETTGTGGSGGDGGNGVTCFENVCPCTEAGSALPSRRAAKIRTRSTATVRQLW